MADVRGGSNPHGGKRENSGRKRKYEERTLAQKDWNSKHKRVYLTLTMYKAWKDAKIGAGYGSCSDSEFAAHLLSLECRRRADDYVNLERKYINRRTEDSIQPAQLSCDITNMEGLTTSTPVKVGLPLPSMLINVSPIVQEAGYPIQPSSDITYAEGSQTLTPLKDRVPLSSMLISTSPIIGEETECDNQMDLDSSDLKPVSPSLERLNVSLFTDDEGEISDDTSSEENVSMHDISCSAMCELNAERKLESETQDDSDEDSELDVSLALYSDIDNEEISDEESDKFREIDRDDNHDKIDTEIKDTCISSVTYGPHKNLSRGEEINNFTKEIKVVSEKKFICSLDLIINVFQARCQTPGCTSSTTVKHHFIGTSLIVNCSCLLGHQYKFCSSHAVNDMYTNNLQAAASILLSGNSFARIERLANFCGLAFLSSSSYYRIQRLYLIPAIDEWWLWMRGQLLEEFSGKNIVVGGDGQCDSPGFNAKNLCYFMVEVKSSYIIDIQVLDKRHVCLASTNMEKEAVKKGLNALCQSLKVVELVTDASSSVKALLANEFKDIIHSLDVWHKSKSIKKCLAKLGKPKAMSKIKDWSAHIARHFWHCASECRKDESTSSVEALKIMKDKWIALLHHVCNEHEWLGGQCEHVDEEHDASLPWFDRRDKDYLELQKVILNPGLLDSFKYYTRFRHTGSIECANSLSLMYTPKRMPFSYKVYKARKQLAAIDWNFHANLPQAKSKKSGDAVVTRKYNQRTRQWDQKIVKVYKGYEYIPILMAGIVRRRQEDVDGVTQIVSLNDSDPVFISPTIAHIPAPPTKDIIRRRSRFGEKK